MKTIYKIFLYLTLTLCLNANLLAAYKPTQAEESVVRVVAYNAGHGTGFFINKEGYIVTNAHVVADNGGFDDTFIAVQNYKNKTYMYKAKLVGTPSIEKDLAILKVNAKTAVPLSIARSEPEKGSTAFAVGFSGANDEFGDVSNFLLNVLEIRLSEDNRASIESLSIKMQELESILLKLKEEIEKLETATDNEENRNKIAEKKQLLAENFSVYKDLEGQVNAIYSIETKRSMRSMEDASIISQEFKSFAEPSIQEGGIEKIVNSTSWGLNNNGKAKVIQHNAPIRGGNSGGPLLNEKGEFIGVNTAGRTLDRNRISVSLSMSSHYDELIAYLNQNNVSFSYASIISVMDILYVALILLALALIALLFKKKSRRTSKKIKHNYSTPKRSYPASASNYKPAGISIKFDFVDSDSKRHKFSADAKYLSETNNYIIMGRSRDFCDIYIDNPSLSKQHLGFRYASGDMYITDRNSLNGVYVNGEKLPKFKSAKITKDSLIKIGNLSGTIKKIDASIV